MDANAEAEEIEPLISRRIRYLLKEYPDVKTWNLYNEAVGAERNLLKISDSQLVEVKRWPCSSTNLGIANCPSNRTEQDLRK